MLLSGYPTMARWVDLSTLDLRPFPSGACLPHQQAWVKLGDPWRHPGDLWGTLTCPVGRWDDKLRVGLLRLALAVGWPVADHGSTEQLLARWGFSQDFQDRFFRPFFGGVFLEPELTTAAAKFCYLFRLFSQSLACLPAAGMQALPERLAQPLRDSVRLQDPVLQLRADGSIQSASGEWRPKMVVLAGAEVEQQLLQRPSEFVGTQTHYLWTSEWSRGDHLHLGPPGQPIAVVAPLAAYSPPGKTLVAVSVVGAELPMEGALGALQAWFPECAWQPLTSYAIPRALPVERGDLRRHPRLGDALFVCGDHRWSGSIDGAMASGEWAAREVLKTWRGGSARVRLSS